MTTIRCRARKGGDLRAGSEAERILALAATRGEVSSRARGERAPRKLRNFARGFPLRPPGWVALLVLLSPGLAVIPPLAEAARPAPPGLSACSYDPKTEGWTVRAQDVPVEDLLSALAARAGFELAGAAPSGTKISLQFRQAPLDQVLRTILKQGRLNYSLIYREGRVRRLILLASAPSGPGGDSEQGLHPGQPGDPAAGSPMSPGSAEAMDMGAPPEQLLKWTRDPDPERRRMAFEALAPFQGEARVNQRLQEGLHDSDPQVRAQVMAILGQPSPEEEAPVESPPEEEQEQ